MHRFAPPFFRAFHALAIENRGRWARLPPGLLAAFYVQNMVDAFERAVPIPEVEIAMHRTAWRQVFRDGPPLAAGRKHIHQAIDYFAHDNSPLAAATLRGRNLRFDQRPLIIRQVAWVTKFAAIV